MKSGGRTRIDGSVGDSNEREEAMRCAMLDMSEVNKANGSMCGNQRSYFVSRQHVTMKPESFKTMLPYVEIIQIK